MSTFTQILYHIVFSTKHREPVLAKDNRAALFKFIWSVIKNKNCHLYRINGVEDHLHIATHIHPSVSLANLIRDIKVSSALFIKEHGLFPDFSHWQKGYGAFTYSLSDKDKLISYIKNQEEHHNGITFVDEYKALLAEHGIAFEERYLF